MRDLLEVVAREVENAAVRDERDCRKRVTARAELLKLKDGAQPVGQCRKTAVGDQKALQLDLPLLREALERVTRYVECRHPARAPLFRDRRDAIPREDHNVELRKAEEFRGERGDAIVAEIEAHEVVAEKPDVDACDLVVGHHVFLDSVAGVRKKFGKLIMGRHHPLQLGQFAARDSLEAVPIYPQRGQRRRKPRNRLDGIVRDIEQDERRSHLPDVRKRRQLVRPE
jgi:hypothetical protein